MNVHLERRNFAQGAGLLAGAIAAGTDGPDRRRADCAVSGN